MVKNACSTFEAFFADVSKNGIPRLSANSYMKIGVSANVYWKNPPFSICKTKHAYLRNRVLYDFLVGHIALVSHQKLVDPLSGIAINFLQPLFDVVERIHVGNIVDNADAVGASIVRGSDRAKSFLARSVPLVITISYNGNVEGQGQLTICNFTVLPSSSIVRIF